ncbi:Ste24 endopeptidase [Halosimplex carlsbadense 2-9-1]|uniref:Ste24 endopeptidase n=1 Tax=Halosimplex carlsbadense 2-9-1 TaxID=797114 RepID=M0CW40_9EURY|nr:M48 family metallopeptidase [Halosimplex carlsbadense]ELZ26868.1 Ste24 endopeptidase [Halosimplex carlsbadense 2-9-1]
MLAFHVAFLALLVGTEAFFTWLAALNVRYGAEAVTREAEWFDDRLDVDDTDELLGYQRATTGASQLEAWIGLALLLVVLYAGLLADAVAAVESLGLGTVPSGVVFFLGVVVALQITSIPFDLFDTFVVEEIFGFNEQSPRLWLRDKLVGLAVALVFTAAIAAAVLWVVESFQNLWWLGAWALFVAFSLSMMVVYPRVIAPLFNDFEPVEEGELHDAVTDVFDRAGFECSQIYVMDASRRSGHSNAYFVGFGATKRVVLFDTLVEQMETDELQGVLAHELAHWKKAHIWKRVGSSALQMGVLLFVAYQLVTGPWLYDMFGLATGAGKPVYAGLLLAALVLQPLSRLTSPIENRLSLAHEREADAFAVEVMGDGEPMVGALTRLASENLSNPFPHPLYETFHYTHPPIPERVRNIRRRADAAASDADDTSAAKAD